MPPLNISQTITEVRPETIFSIGAFPIANSFLAVCLILVLFAFLSLWISRTFILRAGKAQMVTEIIYEKMYDLVGQISGHTYYTKKIFPLVAALFVYIAAANLFGLVPGLTSITYGGASLFRVPTTDFNTTFGLAVAMVLFTQFVSVKDFGLSGHLGKYFQFAEVYRGFKKGIGEGVIAIIGFLIGLLDIVSELAKVISLSLRLFGNLYAGEVMAIVALGALAYGLPALLVASGLFFGIIQAMVFGSLVAAYYMSMVNTDLAPAEEET